MTESEASRDLHSLLDIVENGESVLVTRDGKPVATCIPVRPVKVPFPQGD